MNTPLAYLNGRFVPFAQATLPLHDAGFVAGATVVDNARTFRHKLFRWPDHLARFCRDCTVCYVPLEATGEQLTATAEELIAHNAKLLPPGGELQLVMFATPGPLGVYLGEANNGPSTLGMATYPLPFARYRRFFTDGVTLALSGVHNVNSETVLPPTVKHRSRMLWHIADHKARQKCRNPTALGITLDGPDGAFTETSIGNALAVVDGTVMTPPRRTVLDGISLRVTEELCRNLNIPFAEDRLWLSDLGKFSEVMLTGTAFCLAGVSELFTSNPEPVRFTWPGPVFTKLLAAWSDLVGIDIAKQFTEGSV
jgi:branched-chain amino acid aminotransferase